MKAGWNNRGRKMACLDIKSGAKIAATALQLGSYWELERNGTDEDLQFDAEHHLFTYKGKSVPSTTQILKATNLYPDYSFVDPYYLTRGTYIHRAIELYEKGTLDEERLDPEIVPYLEQWKRVRPQFKFEIIGTEVKLVHPQLLYAGIIDDVITGHTNYALYLTKDSYKLEEIPKIRDQFNYFLSALNVYNWKKQNLKGE
jgi:hypothetical protein